MDLSNKESPIQILLYQIAHVQRYKAMRYLDDIHLKTGQAGCLFILKKYGKLPQKEIARILGVKPPSMTMLLRKLEEKHLVIRRQDEEDQRIFRIELSEEGESYIKKIKETMDNLDAVMFKGILPEEKMFFRRMLLQVRENLMETEDMQDYNMKMHQECISELEKEE
nr:MarR family transcriptional regulator [uncultured Sellimonas sp.]